MRPDETESARVRDSTETIMNANRWTLLLFASLLGGAANVQAQSTPHTRPSPLEYASLPQYCQDLLNPSIGDVGMGRQKWLPVMGETIFHMHHYCYGLIAQMRAERPGRPPIERTRLWRTVVSEVHYVVQRMTPAFVLYPEVMYRRGYALAQLNRDAEAIADFQESFRVKPDYFPAYRELADLYRKRGRTDLAQQVVREGLANAPTAKSLLDLAKELGVTGAGAAVAAKTPPMPAQPPADAAQAPDARQGGESSQEASPPAPGETTGGAESKGDPPRDGPGAAESGAGLSVPR